MAFKRLKLFLRLFFPVQGIFPEKSVDMMVAVVLNGFADVLKIVKKIEILVKGTLMHI